ncbi:hypothetical protein [Paraglaciecola sp.]|uniref:hypothetical protein n=1 Tax=Paraglaciecola sp. TaxID=1920173 RepID=UPI003EF9ABEE
MKVILVFCLSLILSFVVNAQDTAPVNAEVAEPSKTINSLPKKPSQISSTEQTQSKPIDSATKKLSASVNKIQLEATFRGSQEQPKVLTIVPWQLPLFSEVEGQVPNFVAPPQLTPLFRQGFITEQRVYEKLFKSNINL